VIESSLCATKTHAPRRTAITSPDTIEAERAALPYTTVHDTVWKFTVQVFTLMICRTMLSYCCCPLPLAGYHWAVSSDRRFAALAVRL